MNAVKTWDQEIKGNPYAVGDLHGCYSLLMNRLKEIGFDFKNDLLVSVGDLVDRGAENLQCVELLSQPWFTAVLGNHEDLCITGCQGDYHAKQCHISNGGEWFYQLDEQARYNIAKTFSELPVVLEIIHKGKKYGFVHGHIEQNDWDEFKQSFVNNQNDGYRRPAQLAMWGRERIHNGYHDLKYTLVSGVQAVFLGHTVTIHPVRIHNCWYLDTGAVHCGRLTIVNVEHAGETR